MILRMIMMMMNINHLKSNLRITMMIMTTYKILKQEDSINDDIVDISDQKSNVLIAELPSNVNKNVFWSR